MLRAFFTFVLFPWATLLAHWDITLGPSLIQQNADFAVGTLVGIEASHRIQPGTFRWGIRVPFWGISRDGQSYLVFPGVDSGSPAFTEISEERYLSFFLSEANITLGQSRIGIFQSTRTFTPLREIEPLSALFDSETPWMGSSFYWQAGRSSRWSLHSSKMQRPDKWLASWEEKTEGRYYSLRTFSDTPDFQRFQYAGAFASANIWFFEMGSLPAGLGVDMEVGQTQNNTLPRGEVRFLLNFKGYDFSTGVITKSTFTPILGALNERHTTRSYNEKTGELGFSAAFTPEGSGWLWKSVVMLEQVGAFRAGYQAKALNSFWRITWLVENLTHSRQISNSTFEGQYVVFEAETWLIQSFLRLLARFDRGFFGATQEIRGQLFLQGQF